MRQLHGTVREGRPTESVPGRLPDIRRCPDTGSRPTVYPRQHCRRDVAWRGQSDYRPVSIPARDILSDQDAASRRLECADSWIDLRVAIGSARTVPDPQAWNTDCRPGSPPFQPSAQFAQFGSTWRMIPSKIAPPFESSIQGVDWSMPSVQVRQNEPFDVILRRFRRSCERAGIFAESRRRQHYEKPTTIRKRSADAAVRREMKRVSRQKARRKRLY